MTTQEYIHLAQGLARKSVRQNGSCIDTLEMLATTYVKRALLLARGQGEREH